MRQVAGRGIPGKIETAVGVGVSRSERGEECYGSEKEKESRRKDKDIMTH